MMQPRDVMLAQAQAQRHERFMQHAEQSRLAKLARVGHGRQPNRARVAWAWLRRLTVRRGPVREEKPFPIELGLGPAPRWGPEEGERRWVRT